MKKIYESPLNGWDESAERIHLYALDNDEEYLALEDMTYEEKCEYFDVCCQSGCYVAPGALYRTYSFCVHSNHAVIIEYVAYNV